MTMTAWQIFFLSAIPVTELRVTLPLALATGFSPLQAYLLAVGGNLLPILPVLLLLEPVSKVLRKIPLLDRIFERIVIRSRNKGAGVQKYGLIGLLLFVAVPLPGTGAWTGAAIAWLLGFNVWLSFLAIGAGVLLAGVIVTLASLGVIQAALLVDAEIIIGALVIVALLYFRHQRRKKK
ncbi:MAG: small multi-drug export protein [Clostridia bacterium]|jgi:uncharacterized membrane protein|nr:small multi-drug export protein [Clostridia bacterium]